MAIPNNLKERYISKMKTKDDIYIAVGTGIFNPKEGHAIARKAGIKLE
jgi:hypothetical protein